MTTYWQHDEDAAQDAQALWIADSDRLADDLRQRGWKEVDKNDALMIFGSKRHMATAIKRCAGRHARVENGHVKCGGRTA